MTRVPAVEAKRELVEVAVKLVVADGALATNSCQFLGTPLPSRMLDG